jgi:hypothetical protein
MNNDLKKWIDIIKTGHANDVKFAKKKIEKIWHDICRYPDKKEATFYIFLKELKTFSQIKDIDHQTYFIQILKWPIHFLGEKYFLIGLILS